MQIDRKYAIIAGIFVAVCVAIGLGVKFGLPQNATISSTTSTTSKSASSLSVKQFSLVLTHQLVNLDGVWKWMMLANGQLDFPIHVVTGDFVEVEVVNRMNVSTSIHWHGLFQEDTPWMDGAAMVTQGLIASGETLVYKFSTGNQTGSYWWHAHYASQYVDGIRGPFIIHDPQDPYLSQYDEEIIVTLADHFHRSSENVLKEYLYAYDPAPESGLINGRGRYDCNYTAQGVSCIPNSPLTVFNVTQGKRYRLRIINESAQAAFTVSIDGHNMTVIGQDGVYTNPTVVDAFPIATSQRYSVIVTANSAIDNYWFRATMMDMYSPTGTDVQNGVDFNVKAVWRYNGAKDQDPTSIQNIRTSLNVYTLGELNGLTASTIPTNYNNSIYFSFTIAYDPITNASVSTVTLISGTSNFYGSSYQMPPRPTLQDMLLGNPLPDSSNIIPVTNGWVFMQIRNTDNVEHVFHLHGHTFYVIGVGKILHKLTHRSVTKVTTFPRRDAIQVPLCTGGVAGGNDETGCVPGFVNILIPFTHPGAWLFHCHVDWHMQVCIL
ncbi:laccase, multicopper oxidase, benzenediol:oxygen oxidorectuctase [Rhizoclosmatium sp. JEL0117]|nr:laccase, multicopper oxidase, benzenediol:oxygen oxidorectuctase [Rhizoclosmatium sp. JEL0117]